MPIEMLSLKTAQPLVAPAPSPTVVIVVPTPQVFVPTPQVIVPTPTITVPASAPSKTDVVAAYSGVAAVLIAVLALILTSTWNARADRKAADRFTAISDLDVLRQLIAMGIQPNMPVAPVAKGLIDSLPDTDLPVWREVIAIDGRGEPIEPALKAWLERQRDLTRLDVRQYGASQGGPASPAPSVRSSHGR